MNLSEIEGLETSADTARLLAMISASGGSVDTAIVYDTLSGAPLLEQRLDDAVACLSVDGEYLIVIDDECTQLLAIAETGTSVQTRLVHAHHDLPSDHFAYDGLDTPTAACAVPLGNLPGRFALAIGCYAYLLVHHLSMTQEAGTVTLVSYAYQLHTGWAYDPVFVGPRIPGGFLLAGNYGSTIINLWGSDSPKLASLAWSRYCRSYERIYPSEPQRLRPPVSSGLPCEISPCRV